MTRILVDHMPDSPRDCFVARHQNSGYWTCGFQGYVVVCNPERCPYLAEAKGEMKKREASGIIHCRECVKKEKCNFYPVQGDEGYCRYGRNKGGRLNPQN